MTTACCLIIFVTFNFLSANCMVLTAAHHHLCLCQLQLPFLGAKLSKVNPLKMPRPAYLTCRSGSTTPAAFNSPIQCVCTALDTACSTTSVTTAIRELLLLPLLLVVLPCATAFLPATVGCTGAALLLVSVALASCCWDGTCLLGTKSSNLHSWCCCWNESVATLAPACCCCCEAIDGRCNTTCGWCCSCCQQCLRDC